MEDIFFLQKPLTVTDLAEQFGYNPTYMTSMMKKYTGLTVNELLNYYRINAAKNLLSTAMSGAYSIRNIAYLCGFTDEKYFMRVFKKLEGMTPSQYQNAFNEKKMVTK